MNMLALRNINYMLIATISQTPIPTLRRTP